MVSVCSPYLCGLYCHVSRTWSSWVPCCSPMFGAELILMMKLIFLFIPLDSCIEACWRTVYIFYQTLDPKLFFITQVLWHETGGVQEKHPVELLMDESLQMQVFGCNWICLVHRFSEKLFSPKCLSRFKEKGFYGCSVFKKGALTWDTWQMSFHLPSRLKIPKMRNWCWMIKPTGV